MEIKRTTEIFVETKRRFVVWQPEAASQSNCHLCGESVIAAEAAAALLNINCRAVYQFIESGAIHFAETEAGATLVCPTSIAALLDDDAKPISAKTTE